MDLHLTSLSGIPTMFSTLKSQTGGICFSHWNFPPGCQWPFPNTAQVWALPAAWPSEKAPGETMNSDAPQISHLNFQSLFGKGILPPHCWISKPFFPNFKSWQPKSHLSVANFYVFRVMKLWESYPLSLKCILTGTLEPKSFVHEDWVFPSLPLSSQQAADGTGHQKWPTLWKSVVPWHLRTPQTQFRSKDSWSDC